MLYPKSKTEKLDMALFQNPTAEYRGAPFWAWNCEMTPDLLEKEIDKLGEMGFGGFMMHPRVGMATPYLSDEFMSLVSTCIERGKQNQMLSWLYDEDKWPSGFAGGFNTKNVENRQKCLFVTGIPYDDGTLLTEYDKAHSTDKIPSSPYRLLGCFDVLLDDACRLVSYQRIDLSKEVPTGHEKWFAYIEYAAPSPYFNNQAYCDTLQKSVVDNFLQITHEAYKKQFKEEFGKAIPAIFTDEPNFKTKSVLNFASDKKGIVFPYTTDFSESFEKTYGINIEDHFPVLVWEPANGIPSQLRYWYHDHITERFTEAFCDTVGDWCKENDILMTGHVLNEPTLTSQAICVGEAMRCYRGFTLPGIDMLCDHRELNTAKQAQSAAHQYGCPGVTSELYGVTNWNFDFRGHKLQGDWQAALGVTCRIPHLFWVSMGGEAKRDYPASIGYQSPWYTEYRRIEDHFARVNTVMTRGIPNVKIGVLHPIESCWLHFGPNDQTKRIRNDLDARFAEFTEWMLYGLLDFDFISESLLPSQYEETETGFAVGQMKYDVVVVPALETIRSTTLNILKEFRNRGGEVIFVGEAPIYMDAVPSDEPAKFAVMCKQIPWLRNNVCNSLQHLKFVDIQMLNGVPSDNLFYQLRDDGEKKNLFITHVKKPKNYDVAPIEAYHIHLRGEWSVSEYDTLCGEKKKLRVSYENGKTSFDWVCSSDSSLLLELSPEKDLSQDGFVYADIAYSAAEYPAHSALFELLEPNVLLLDRAEYRIGDGEWNPRIDILKADEIIRRTLGLHVRGNQMAQPWIEPLDKNPTARVSLRFRIESEIEYEGAELALEAPEYSEVVWNGISVPMTVNGYYIDEASIKTISIPRIEKGTNELIVNLRVGDITPIESYYLIGNFGVECLGDHVLITDLPKCLYFDSITKQKLPFYGGNIRYKMKFSGGGKKTVEISKYRGAVIKVFLDGECKGYIDFPPHRLYLGNLSDGEHDLELVFFGNRMNTLGQLHNTNDDIPWAGNASWRTKGRFWTDEYQLYPTGIMTAPRILTEE